MNRFGMNRFWLFALVLLACLASASVGAGTAWGQLAETAGAPATELTIWSLFIRADIVVKTTMVILALASVLSWAVVLSKFLLLRRVKNEAQRFLEAFRQGTSFAQLYQLYYQAPPDPMSAVFVTAMQEWRRAPVERALPRVRDMMELTLSREIRALGRYQSLLATVGSSAPFIGLFGTVWGIMNAFQSIALTRQTHLAVVAPGIAEALFATALGLIAAIPAVIAYNWLSSRLNEHNAMIEDFIQEIGVTLSRYFDEKKPPPASAS